MSQFQVETISLRPSDGKCHVLYSRPPHQHLELDIDADEHPALKAIIPTLEQACIAAANEIFLDIVGFGVPDSVGEVTPQLPCRICGKNEGNNTEKAPNRFFCPDHA